MKEFVVSANDFKAKLKIDGKEYCFRSPTTGELRQFNEKAKVNGGDTEAVNIMEDLLSSLGSIEKEALEKLPADTFMALFKHLVTPFGDDASKKN